MCRDTWWFRVAFACMAVVCTAMATEGFLYGHVWPGIFFTVAVVICLAALLDQFATKV